MCHDMWKLSLSRRSSGLSTGFDGVSGIPCVLFVCRESSTCPFGIGGSLVGLGGSVEAVAAAESGDVACTLGVAVGFAFAVVDVAASCAS
eukprot:326607-Amphidinium_carterae.1